jgi:hypothetical protein
MSGRDSVADTATCCILDGPRIKSWWGQDFQHPPSLLYTWYWVSFLGVKHPGHGVDHPPPSSPKVKERVQLYAYSTFWAFMASSRVSFTFYRIMVQQTSECNLTQGSINSSSVTTNTRLLKKRTLKYCLL